MCVSPCYLDDMTEVACRYCWQCKANRVNDLVGRCIAESKSAKKTYAVTLTYANQAGVNAVTLVYKDVQIFLKRLRRRYGKVRYICAGEYGTEKGRSHWHIGLFFYDKEPKPQNMPQLRFGEDLPPNEYRVDWEPWEHGFSYFQEPHFGGDHFKYLMKYAIKDQDLDSSDRRLSMSKKPPLGHHFMMDLAKRYVEEAVIPRSFKYKIAGVKKNNGKEKIFMMQGKTRENFMNAFKEGWIKKYGEEPCSEFYEEWDERNFTVNYTDEELIKRLHHKPVRYYEPWKSYDANNGEWVEMNYQGTDLIMWKRDKGAWVYTQTGEAWQEKRQEIIENLEQKGQIKRRRQYDFVLREYLEQM